MRSVVVLLGLWFGLGAAEACEKVANFSPHDTELLTYPVIRLEVIDIPATARAEGVIGRVVLIAPSGRWIPVKNGTLLGSGARIRIDAGAGLTVRASTSWSIDLCSAESERWVAGADETAWHLTTGCSGPERDKVLSIFTAHRPAAEAGR